MTFFDPTLESVRLHAKWQLEASRLKVAGMEHALHAARMALDTELANLDQVLRDGAASLPDADPLLVQRLAWQVAQIRRRVAEREQALFGLEQSAKRLRSAQDGYQNRLEAMTTQHDAKTTQLAHQDAARAIRAAGAARLNTDRDTSAQDAA